jgi:ketosteroid isomerase-like protein
MTLPRRPCDKRGMSNADTITRFYAAFARGDAEGMVACYADDVVFSDAAFGELRGRDAGDMWRMLCARSKGDLVVEASNIKADGDRGSAHWDATYHFGPKKRRVVNRIDASFRFGSDGRIVEHRDVFDFKVWAGQALGLPGRLFGGTTFIQNTVRQQALKGLHSFQQKQR